MKTKKFVEFKQLLSHQNNSNLDEILKKTDKEIIQNEEDLQRIIENFTDLCILHEKFKDFKREFVPVMYKTSCIKYVVYVSGKVR